MFWKNCSRAMVVLVSHDGGDRASHGLTFLSISLLNIPYCMGDVIKRAPPGDVIEYYALGG